MGHSFKANMVDSDVKYLRANSRNMRNNRFAKYYEDVAPKRDKQSFKKNDKKDNYRFNDYD